MTIQSNWLIHLGWSLRAMIIWADGELVCQWLQCSSECLKSQKYSLNHLPGHLLWPKLSRRLKTPAGINELLSTRMAGRLEMEWVGTFAGIRTWLTVGGRLAPFAAAGSGYLKPLIRINLNRRFQKQALLSSLLRLAWALCFPHIFQWG